MLWPWGAAPLCAGQSLRRLTCWGKQPVHPINGSEQDHEHESRKPGRRSQERLEDLRRSRTGSPRRDPEIQPLKGRGAGAVRSRRRRPRRQHQRRRGRSLLHHGPVRLGQVDPGAPHQPADRADPRPDPDQRHRRRRPRRRRPAGHARRQDRHGVPEHGAATAPHGARQHRLRARTAQRRCLYLLRGGRAGDRDGAPAGLRRPPAVGTVRRHAAARRPGPRARRRSRHPADGRAVLGAGPADPPRPAGRVPGPVQDHAQDHAASPTTSTRRSAWARASPS